MLILGNDVDKKTERKAPQGKLRTFTTCISSKGLSKTFYRDFDIFGQVLQFIDSMRHMRDVTEVKIYDDAGIMRYKFPEKR